jgi:hypothetical protein
MVRSIGRARGSMPLVAYALACSVLVGCGGGTRRVNVRVPPRLDIGQYGHVALATFTIENGKGQLNQLATNRFSEEVLGAQQVEILEIGSIDSVLRRVGEVRFSSASAQAVGASRDIPAVFAGHLKISDVKPAGKVFGLNLPRIEATVTVELTVGLFSTKTGGTLWRASASATEKVGQMGMSGGQPYFSAKDPNEAYGHLVNILVASVTNDLRPTWHVEERSR